MRSHVWRTVANSAAYLIPHLKPGLKILDVGCGPGTITVDLAATYVPQGHVTGMEYVSVPLEKARAHATERSVTNVDFIVGDAHALPFPDATFDITHAHQVLQHIADPVLALKEMRRVTKPGGLVASRESDFGGFVWFPESAGLEKWHALYQRVARGNGGEPLAGRRLRMWARMAGFREEDVTCSTATWCFSAPEERAWWGGLWADRIVQSNFKVGAAEQGATMEELQILSEAWRAWALEEDGFFAVLHGEVICRV